MSYWSGQRALQPLPSKSQSRKRTIENYPISEELIQDRETLNFQEDAGLPVLKVTKVCPFVALFACVQK